MPNAAVKTSRSIQPRRSKIRMCRKRWYRASIVASTAMTASLTMSVVSRNWSAERKRAPSSTAAILRRADQLPTSNSQLPGRLEWKAPCELKVGNWELTSYDRKHDWSADYRVRHDVSPHGQA